MSPGTVPVNAMAVNYRSNVNQINAKRLRYIIWAKARTFPAILSAVLVAQE